MREHLPKILLIVSSYAPTPGGLQAVTRSLAGELHRRGHEVAVITSRHPRSLPAHETIDGVPIERLFFLTPSFRQLKNGRFDLFLASLILFPLTLARLIWRIARERPDVVNLHFVGAPTPFVLFAHRLLRFRLVVSLHGDDVEGASARSRSSQRLLRAVLRRADTVTACSHYLLRQAALFEPAVSRKGSVIHNGIDLPDPCSAEAGDYIFAVGRMVKKKGFDTLLRAVAESGARLELVGDGPEREALHSLALVLGLNGRARFHQVRDRSEMLSLMASSRAVIIPSRQEPFGLVALEAMSVGRPIIASFVGGLPEVLAGADACFVPPDRPKELAAAISSVRARLQEEPEFGSRNRSLAARFSTATMVDQYAAVYSKESGN